MITGINRLGTWLVDQMLQPFQAMSPWPSLLVASLLVTVLALLAFKYLSDQKTLKQCHDRVIARLLEIQLYQDDLMGIFGTFGRLLLGIFQYLGETVKSLAVLAIPMTLLMIQFGGWFQFRGLKQFETAVVTVKVDERFDLEKVRLDLQASPEIAIETQPFVAAAEHEVLWRIRPQALNSHAWIQVTVADQTLRKTVHCSDGLSHISSVRVRDGFWRRLSYPVESPLPSGSPVREIRIDYPVRAIPLFRFDINWLVALFGLSLILGLALKRPLRVAL